MAVNAKRVLEFEELLSQESVDIDRLSQLCLHGIPDRPNTLRPLCWRILLGYEPVRQSDRSAFLRKQRREYYNFVNDLLVDPFIEASKETKPSKNERRSKKGKKPSEPTKIESNPLNDDSRYTDYYADNLVLEQIDKDVRRGTLADIAFFQQPVPISLLSPLSPHLKPKLSMEAARTSIDMQLGLPKATVSLDPASTEDVQLQIKTRRTIFARLRHLNKDFGARDRSPRPSLETGRVASITTNMDEEDIEDLHWESIERILFIYAKLNPAIKYVQGMNELLAPLYFVLANDESAGHRAHAEADSFYCFTALMSDCRDLFERTHDHNTSDDAGRGVSAVLTRFMDRLKYLDPVLHENMMGKAIEPTYFAFRWYCCLMAQEFDLPGKCQKLVLNVLTVIDVIRLWDSIFADRCLETSDNPGYLTDFCCALLINVRDELIAQSFADNIKLLQQYPSQDIGPILSLAIDLRKQKTGVNSAASVRKFIHEIKLPQFGFERTSKLTATSEALNPGDATNSTFPSMKSFKSLLGSGKPISKEATLEVDRSSIDIVRPQVVRLQTNGQQIFHAPPSEESTEASSRLSYEFMRPQIPSLSLAGAKKWFSTVPEDSELDPAADSRFGLFKSKSTSFFKKAGAFVSNSHQSGSMDEVYYDVEEGRVSPVLDKTGRRSRSGTLMR